MKRLVLFFAALALVITSASPPISLAQEKSAAELDPRAAVQSHSDDVLRVATSETPEKFRKLLSKWKYDDDRRFTTTFEIQSISVDGRVTIKNYLVGGRPVDPPASVKEENGRLQLTIQLPGGRWELEYADTFGGMLFGHIRLPAMGERSGKFYREK